MDESFCFEPYSYGTEAPKLYLVRDGYYTPFADFTLKTEEIREDARYALTSDNRLVQISHDGSFYNTLYTGNNIRWGLAFFENRVFFGDGEALIELDLTTHKYRVILEKEALVTVQLLTTDDKTLIRFVAYEGLAIEGHNYDPQTGSLVK